MSRLTPVTRVASRGSARRSCCRAQRPSASPLKTSKWAMGRLLGAGVGIMLKKALVREGRESTRVETRGCRGAATADRPPGRWDWWGHPADCLRVLRGLTALYRIRLPRAAVPQRRGDPVVWDTRVWGTRVCPGAGAWVPFAALHHIPPRHPVGAGVRPHRTIAPPTAPSRVPRLPALSELGSMTVQITPSIVKPEGVCDHTR